MCQMKQLYGCMSTERGPPNYLVAHNFIFIYSYRETPYPYNPSHTTMTHPIPLWPTRHLHEPPHATLSWPNPPWATSPLHDPTYPTMTHPTLGTFTGTTLTPLTIINQQFCQSLPDSHFVDPGGGDLQSTINSQHFAWKGSHLNCQSWAHFAWKGDRLLLILGAAGRKRQNYAAPLSPCEARGYN